MRAVAIFFFGTWGASLGAAFCGITMAMVEGGSHVLGALDFVVLGLSIGVGFLVGALGGSVATA